MKSRISKNFHVPLNSLSNVKTAKSSLARGHMGGALGFGLTFPNPKRALGAHGGPHWGSSAPAHHTHPLAMQPAGGAHASSSSIVARALSAAVSLACSRCALYWGRGRGEGGPPVRGTVGAPAPLVL